MVYLCCVFVAAESGRSPHPARTACGVGRGGRAELPTGFAAFVRVLFGSRRKTLRHALRRLDPPAGDVVLEAWGSRRVEGCGPEQLLELYAAWVSGQN